VIETAIISDADALGRLRPEWERLWQRDPNATPFQSASWQMAWWRHFGTAEPLLVIARRNGDLVGLLPLYLLREPGCTKLLPIGVAVSDYIAIVVDPCAGDVGDILTEAIAGIKDWDECWLPDLVPDAALARARAGSGLQVRTTAATPCPVLELPVIAGTLDAVARRKTLRDLRQVRARSAAVGGARIEVVGGDRLDIALDDLFSLHEQRWRSRGEAGVCVDPRLQAFHREAARGLLAQGMLRLYRLWIGSAVAAVFYGFAAKGVVYAYLGGFDPTLPRLSPGAQIIAYAIAEAIAEGATQFDFLRGGEAYKYAWGAVDRPKISRHFTRQCSNL
jgi:CelD/BcsL family acetyltransferase involved in cellulose biosynthesis